MLKKNSINGISDDIKFTMGIEDNNCILFLDLLIIRNENGTLGHQIFRKKTHTDSYLYVDS